MGCRGGWPDNCMWYVFDNGGISLLGDYPYMAMDTECIADFNGPVSVSTVHPVKSKSEEQLKAIVEKVATSLLEKIAWEVVPDLAENLIKEELRKIREEAG